MKYDHPAIRRQAQVHFKNVGVGIFQVFRKLDQGIGNTKFSTLVRRYQGWPQSFRERLFICGESWVKGNKRDQAKEMAMAPEATHAWQDFLPDKGLLERLFMQSCLLAAWDRADTNGVLVSATDSNLC